MRFSNVKRDRMIVRDVRFGFTLIEILTVIIIIGIVAGLALVSVVGARRFFAGATAKARIDDIAQAVEIYKQKYGEYPPDLCKCEDFDEAEVKNDALMSIRRHILKRWPGVLKSRTANIDEMCETAYAEMSRGAGWPLLFWLAGPDGEGFSADEKDPFADGDNRETPVIELTLSTSDGTDGNWNENVGLMYKGKPIAYFRAEGPDGYADKELHTEDGSDDNVAAPYMKNGAWYNADSFQLIWVGEDGNFGSHAEHHHEHAHHSHESDEHSDEEESRDLGTNSNISTFDRDNVTNFTNGATIESEME